MEVIWELGVCLAADPTPVHLEQWLGEIDRYSEAIDKLRE
jgi:hypothetical protein